MDHCRSDCLRICLQSRSKSNLTKSHSLPTQNGGAAVIIPSLSAEQRPSVPPAPGGGVGVRGGPQTDYEKRQARMIKNREAATLSRKRRKVCTVQCMSVILSASCYIII